MTTMKEILVAWLISNKETALYSGLSSQVSEASAKI